VEWVEKMKKMGMGKGPRASKGNKVGPHTKHGPGTMPKGKGSGKMPKAKKAF
jgi:hypothetical protein